MNREIEQNKKLQELLSEKDKALMDAFPELIIHTFSRAADHIVVKQKKWVQPLHRIYYDYADECIAYAADYLTYPVYGLEEHNTMYALDKLKIGLVFYSFWACLCPGWNLGGKDKRGKKLPKLPHAFFEQVFTLFDTEYPELNHWTREGIHDLAARNDTGIMMSGYTVTILMGLYAGTQQKNHKMNKEVLEKIKGSLISLYRAFDLYDVIGWKGSGLGKEEVDMAKRYFNSYAQLKSIFESTELSLWNWENPVEIDYAAILKYSMSLFGLSETNINETFSKKEREEILTIIYKNTYFNKENGGNDVKLSEKEQLRTIIFAQGCYLLSREKVRQVHEKLLFMLRTENRERKNADILKEIREREKEGESALKETERNLSERENLKKQVRELERAMSESNMALADARNKLAAKDQKIETLMEELELLKANNKPVEKGQKIHISTEELELLKACAAQRDSSLSDRVRAEIYEEYYHTELLEPEKLSPEEILEAVREYLKTHKVVWCGGNRNQVKKLERRYPEMVFLETERVVDYNPLIQRADLILFKNDSISHMMFKKARDTAVRLGIPFNYCDPVSNLERVDLSLYEKFKETETKSRD